MGLDLHDEIEFRKSALKVRQFGNDPGAWGAGAVRGIAILYAVPISACYPRLPTRRVTYCFTLFHYVPGL